MVTRSATVPTLTILIEFVSTLVVRRAAVIVLFLLILMMSLSVVLTQVLVLLGVLAYLQVIRNVLLTGGTCWTLDFSMGDFLLLSIANFKAPFLLDLGF